MEASNKNTPKHYRYLELTRFSGKELNNSWDDKQLNELLNLTKEHIDNLSMLLKNSDNLEIFKKLITYINKYLVGTRIVIWKRDRTIRKLSDAEIKFLMFELTLYTNVLTKKDIGSELQKIEIDEDVIKVKDTYTDLAEKLFFDDLFGFLDIAIAADSIDGIVHTLDRKYNNFSRTTFDSINNENLWNLYYFVRKHQQFSHIFIK